MSHEEKFQFGYSVRDYNNSKNTYLKRVITKFIKFNHKIQNRNKSLLAINN